MWIATIIVAYLVLSLIGVLIFCCAFVIASSMEGKPQQENQVREPSAVEPSALSDEMLTSISEPAAQEVVAQSQ